MEISDQQDGPMDDRAVDPAERSGVLHPGNLSRYRARWFTPDQSLTEVVDSYWAVEWDLGRESITQKIVAAPAVTLTLESGAVPAPMVITGVHRRAWVREIHGAGTVFGVRLRPGGLAVLSALKPQAIADDTVAVTPALDARLHALLMELRLGATPAEQVSRADAAIRARLEERPVTTTGLLANAAVSELARRAHPVPTPELAATFGVSDRTLQRALRRTIGQGPLWVGRWLRLQEVVRALSSPGAPAVSELAAGLNYVDHAHLLNDFRSAVGMTPGAYVLSLRELAAGSA